MVAYKWLKYFNNTIQSSGVKIKYYSIKSKYRIHQLTLHKTGDTRLYDVWRTTTVPSPIPTAPNQVRIQIRRESCTVNLSKGKGRNGETAHIFSWPVIKNRETELWEQKRSVTTMRSRGGLRVGAGKAFFSQTSCLGISATVQDRIVNTLLIIVYIKFLTFA